MYEAIWGAFTRWCCVERIPALSLERITVSDLEAFLATRSGRDAEDRVTPRHQWQVLNLIDRVLAHRAFEQPEVTPNSAAKDLMASRDEIRRANMQPAGLPSYLEAAEAKRLVVFLVNTPAAVDVEVTELSWQDLRDRASVALQLGAGLAPGEVRSLRLANVIVAGGKKVGLPWKVRVPADGNTPERETPVAEWAGKVLRSWMELRDKVGFPSDWLFPSTRKGSPWSKVSQYEAVKRVLEAAGIDETAGGSFRLRHTFAIRQLRRGTPAAEVANYMGIVDPDLMDRYTRVLSRSVDVV